MSPETMLVLPILIPVILAAAVPALRKSVKLIAALPLVAAVVSAIVYLGVASGAPVKLVAPWVGAFSFDLALDGWRALLLVFVLIFQVMTGLYCMAAVPRLGRPALATASILVASGAACGVVLSANVLFLLVFWEIFLVALYGAIHSGGAGAERVAQKALIIGGASDFLMILGLMLYLSLGGLPNMESHLEVARSPWLLTSFLLIFLGAGAKAGMFPFHTWIPEAAQAMPAVGFAAMPASLEKVLGISFLFTLTTKMFVLSPAAISVMLVFAVATAFVTLFPALAERDLKKVLALLAISPVGFMVAGMATSEAAGIAGALMYMLTHATYKSGMFFAAGTFEAKTGSSRLSDLTGVGRRLPVAGWGFVLAFVAAISLPPTGGFMAKELIFEGLLGHGHTLVFALLWIAALLNIAVFCKVVAVIMGRGVTSERTTAPALELLPVLLLGGLAVLTGAIFTGAGAAFTSEIEGAELNLISGVWHIGPLTIASLLLYLLGFMLYFEGRSRVSTAALTFDGLRESPTLGRALAMAEAKKFDAYEIGLQVVELVTRVVFRYFDRLIDVVVDGIIGIGQSLSRHFLSAVHNGLYSTYLGWVVVGFVVVLSLVFM